MTSTVRGEVAPTDSGGGVPGKPGAGAAGGPGGVPPVVDTSALDTAVREVAAQADAWAALPAAARADLLDQVLRDTMAASDDWLAAACAAKGLRPGSTEAGEE